MISSTVMAQTTKKEGVVISIYIFIAAAAYNITLYPQTNSVNNLLSCGAPIVWAQMDIAFQDIVKQENN